MDAKLQNAESAFSWAIRHGLHEDEGDNMSVTRAAYIKNNGLDPRSQTAMEALETAVCNQDATSATAVQVAGAVN